MDKQYYFIVSTLVAAFDPEYIQSLRDSGVIVIVQDKIPLGDPSD